METFIWHIHNSGHLVHDFTPNLNQCSSQPLFIAACNGQVTVMELGSFLLQNTHCSKPKPLQSFLKKFSRGKAFFFPPFFPFSASGLRQSWSRKDLSDMGKSKLPHPNSLNMKPLFRGVELYIWTPVLLMDNLWMASVLGVEKFRFWL